MSIPRTAFTRRLQKAYQKALQELYQKKQQPANTEPDTGRREFITTAGLAVASLAIPDFLYPLAPAEKMKGRKYSIAIIGGGIAGLAAANTFFNTHKDNIEYTVYEASGRTGGRMFTQTMEATGLTRELGGEFVDTGHADMLALIREFKLEKINCAADNNAHHLTEHRFYFGKKLRTEKDVIRELKKIIPAIQADKKKIELNRKAELDRLDQLSLEDYLKKLKVTGWFYNLLYWIFTAEFGLSSSEISCLNFIDMVGVEHLNQFEIFGVSDEVYKIKGGNELLIKKMTEKLSDHIKMGYKLTSIKKNKTQYSLSFDGKEDITADHVLLTLPFTILRNIDMGELFLPQERLKAIHEMGYGTNSKLLMETDTRPWRVRGSSGYLFNETIQNGWDSSQLQHDNKGAGGYTVFLGGAEGASLNKDTVDLQKYIAAFNEAFNLTPGDTNISPSPTVFNWFTQKYTAGSYACFKTGQWNFFRQHDLMEPCGNIYFAGEHCSSEFQGFMNGAAETGNRAAKNILRKMLLTKAL